MKRKKIILTICIGLSAVLLLAAIFLAVPPAKFGVRVAKTDAAAVLTPEEVEPSYNKPAYGVYSDSTDLPLEHLVQTCTVAVQGKVLWRGKQTQYFHPYDGTVRTKANLQMGSHEADSITLWVTHQLVGEWQTGRVIEVSVGKNLKDYFSPGQEVVLFLKRTNLKSNGIYQLMNTHGVVQLSRKAGLYTYSRDKDLCIYDGQNVQTLWLDIASAAQKAGRQTQVWVK